MTVAEGGGIFVSYRRQETSHLAGRLYDRLADRFGESQVFIDVDAIEPGVDFAEEIFRAVAACKVLLAIIGAAWLTATDERGGRWFDDPTTLCGWKLRPPGLRGGAGHSDPGRGRVMLTRQDLPESSLALQFAVTRWSFGTVSFRYDAAPGHGDRAGAGGTRHRQFQRSRCLHGVRSAEMLWQGAQKGLDLPENDIARAARLLADAERIASSITVESWKVGALSDVAKAVAATDPGRAERIASAITVESWKVGALSRVAEVVAATDPGRAARLLADAERIASSITNKSSKASALSDVARALAAASS
jgi:hypothetical protein